MMREHPIEGLMINAMDSIKDMVDVNTIIGDPIETNNTVIIPISKVSFGFAAGGSEFTEETIDEYSKKDREDETIKYKLPFGGGSGAGVSINPVAFIIVQEEKVKLLPVNHSSTIDKLLDYVPDLLDKIGNKFGKNDKIKQQVEEIIEDEKNSKEKDNSKIEYSKIQVKDEDD